MEVADRLDFRFSNVLVLFWASFLLALIVLIDILYVQEMPMDLLVITNAYFFIAILIVLFFSDKI